METTPKSTRAVLKLTKDTIDGKVNWSIVSKAKIVLGSEEEILDNVYKTKYLNNFLRVYKYRDKAYHDYLEYTWVDGYRLEMIDENNNSLWEFPSDHAIIGLYETVKEKTSGANTFLDEILKDI